MIEKLCMLLKAFDPCKSNKYTISSGGYFVCNEEGSSDEEDKIIEGFQTGSQNPDPNQSIVIIEENQAKHIIRY